MTIFPDPPPQPTALIERPDISKKIDDRIYFDQKANLWIFQDSEQNGTTEYQYNFILERWIPRYDEDETIERHDGKASIDDEEVENKRVIQNLKRQKLNERKEKIKKQRNNDNVDNSNQKTNTGVYVSQIPDDCGKEELEEIFSKYGMIAEDFKTGERRVKLYYEEGKFKNEALIIYQNKESVPLAIEMLDGTFIRQPGKQVEGLKVEVAEFKKSNRDSNGPKKTLDLEEKKLIQKRKELVKRKLNDWDDNDPGLLYHDHAKTSDIKRRLWDKIVVIENMFRKEEFKSDPSLELDLREDIEEECGRLGIVEDISKISFFDLSGTVTVKFKNRELSMKCIEEFNGRFFDGLRLNAYQYNGEKFERSPDNEKERLEAFGNFIEVNQV